MGRVEQAFKFSVLSESEQSNHSTINMQGKRESIKNLLVADMSVNGMGRFFSYGGGGGSERYGHVCNLYFFSCLPLGGHSKFFIFFVLFTKYQDITICVPNSS